MPEKILIAINGTLNYCRLKLYLLSVLAKLRFIFEVTNKMFKILKKNLSKLHLWPVPWRLSMKYGGLYGLYYESGASPRLVERDDAPPSLSKAFMPVQAV